MMRCPKCGSSDTVSSHGVYRCRKCAAWFLSEEALMPAGEEQGPAPWVIAAEGFWWQ